MRLHTLRRALVNSGDVQAIGALVVIAAFVSWVTLWFRPGLADWDIMSFYLPWYAQMGDSLRNFDIPGWNPYILSGTPFAGNPQSGWWYFPAMVFFTLFPPVLAFKLSILFHFVLGALAAYCLARLLGLGIVGSFVAGFVFGVSQNLGIATCCTIHLQLASWLPVALIGIELGVRQIDWDRRLLAFSLTGLALSQMAAAWVGQGMYNGFLLVVGYVLWRCLIFPADRGEAWTRRLRQTVVAGGWSFGLGLALAAAGLLPRLDVVRRTFVGSDEYRGELRVPEWGTDWWHMIEMLTRFRWDWYPFYAGGAVLTLALIGAIGARRNPALWYFVGLAIVVVVLPVRDTPLQRLFYGALPQFRDLHLHDPKRILAVLPLATAILAGAGTQRIAGHGLDGRPPRWVPLIALAVLVGTFANWHRTWSWLSTTTLSTAVLLAVLAAPLLILKVERSVRGQRLAIAALLLPVLIDPTGHVLVHAATSSRNASDEAAIMLNARTTDTDGAGAFLKEQVAQGELFRYYGFIGPAGAEFQAHEHFAAPWVIPLLINNRAMRLRLYDVQGYDPAQLEAYRHAFTALNGFSRDYHEALVYRQGVASPLLNMLNVRYLILPTGNAPFPDGGATLDLPPGYELVFESDGAVVYENPDALPRAWMVHSAQSVDQTRALSLIASGEVDPGTTALLEGELPNLAPLPVGASDIVAFQTYHPDEVILDVIAGAAAILVVADSFDPSWTVRVDGQERPLLAVNEILRGVAIPAGAHQVEFTYQPASLEYGLAITAAAVLIVTVLVAMVLIRRRRFGVADQAT